VTSWATRIRSRVHVGAQALDNALLDHSAHLVRQVDHSSNSPEPQQQRRSSAAVIGRFASQNTSARCGVASGPVAAMAARVGVIAALRR